VTVIGGVRVQASSKGEGKERNENPLRRMRFGVGHNGHGIAYLVHLQCFDEFNVSLANVKMDGFRTNMGYTEILVGPNEDVVAASVGVNGWNICSCQFILMDKSVNA